MLAAIRIDAVGVTIQDRHTFDVHVTATQQADVVIGRVLDRDVAHRNVTTVFEGDGFRSMPLGAVAIDHARTHDADVFHVLATQQRVLKIRRLVVRK